MNANLDLYYERMEQSLGDKKKIVDNVKKGKILEVGFGSGLLMRVLEELGNTVYGVDISEESVEHAKENGIENVFLGGADDIDKLFAPESFDTIIFCSVLHEVFSTDRNNYYTDKFSINNAELRGANAVIRALNKAYKLLKPNGRVIIRDGVAVSDRFRHDLVVFSLDEEKIHMLDDYMDFPLNPTEYRLTEQDGKYIVATSLENALEFLYTYTWGEKSMPREREEKYGVLSLDSYKLLLQSVGFSAVSGISYLQQGYVDNLEHVEFINLTRINNRLPDTNMILVGRK